MLIMMGRYFIFKAGAAALKASLWGDFSGIPAQTAPSGRF